MRLFVSPIALAISLFSYFRAVIFSPAYLTPARMSFITIRLHRQQVTALAMRLSGVYRRWAIASQSVVFGWNEFNVSRITAGAISTNNVIQFRNIFSRSDRKRLNYPGINQPVRGTHLPPKPDLTVSSFSVACYPIPTVRYRVHFNLGEYAPDVVTGKMVNYEVFKFGHSWAFTRDFTRKYSRNISSASEPPKVSPLLWLVSVSRILIILLSLKSNCSESRVRFSCASLFSRKDLGLTIV